MNISSKPAACIIAALLVLATYAGASANPPGNHSRPKLENGYAVMGQPCIPLSWEVANKLPWYISPRAVACMTLKVDDLQASQRARALLVKAASYAQNVGVAADSQTGIAYRDGVTAYAEGRYLDAIADFEAAMPSIKTVGFSR